MKSINSDTDVRSVYSLEKSVFIIDLVNDTTGETPTFLKTIKKYIVRYQIKSGVKSHK